MLNILEKNLNYIFNNKELLNIALTHPSYANEHKIDKCYTNQRLEFLGDAVLELCSSDFLYNYYNDKDEGFLTKIRAKLVCEESLSDVARKLKIYEYILLGKGENIENVKQNNSIMCDTLESIIGAIYLDSNINFAKEFITNNILTLENLNKIDNDYKSLIQEKANKHKINLSYELIDEYGPDHNKTFTVLIKYGDKITCKGIGKSKKEAEQNAAKSAFQLIK